MMRTPVVMVTYLLVLLMTWRACSEQVVKPVVPCNLTLFSSSVNEVCLDEFSQAMAASSYQERCPWPAVKGFQCPHVVIQLNNCALLPIGRFLLRASGAFKGQRKPSTSGVARAAEKAYATLLAR
ncbi:unnamed protein product [Gadus morhua 'NCC']